MKKTSLLFLFTRFFLLGITTFGGGLAMLTAMKLLAIKQGWLTEEEWTDTVTLAQLAPGAIAINVVHLLGYRARKHLGGFVSVLGMVLPSVIVIILVATFLQPWINHPRVQGVLEGIFLAVVLLIGKAWFDLAKVTQGQWIPIVFVGVMFTLVYVGIFNAMMSLLFSLVLGVGLAFVPRRKL
jgi:chromate transporter